MPEDSSNAGVAKQQILQTSVRLQRFLRGISVQSKKDLCMHLGHPSKQVKTLSKEDTEALILEELLQASLHPPFDDHDNGLPLCMMLSKAFAVFCYNR